MLDYYGVAHLLTILIIFIDETDLFSLRVFIVICTRLLQIVMVNYMGFAYNYLLHVYIRRMKVQFGVPKYFIRFYAILSESVASFKRLIPGHLNGWVTLTGRVILVDVTSLLCAPDTIKDVTSDCALNP